MSGRVDWAAVKDIVGELLADWKSSDADEPGDGQRGVKNEHLDHQSNQTQIGIAYPSVPYRHPDYFRASGAVGVLSGGMSARLFTEVREKRGLCYTVFASHHTQRDRACVLCYAGTSSERAQETLDVTLGELRRISKGILSEELSRLKARVKSGLIMQGESSSARSGAIARLVSLGAGPNVGRIGQISRRFDRHGNQRVLGRKPAERFYGGHVGSGPAESAGCGMKWPNSGRNLTIPQRNQHGIQNGNLEKRIGSCRRMR